MWLSDRALALKDDFLLIFHTSNSFYFYFGDKFDFCAGQRGPQSSYFMFPAVAEMTGVSLCPAIG
jgi:hypothetical protein